MITVDLRGDQVLVGKEPLTPGEVHTLVVELMTALQLVADARPERPEWRLPQPGVGHAILADGRELRVEKTDRGWIGYINGQAVNADSPATRKRDAQELVVSRL